MAQQKKQSFIDQALAMEGVSDKRIADLARSINIQESGGHHYRKDGSVVLSDPTKYGRAVGTMQLLPDTFKQVADKGWDINNPLDNARAGVRYIQYLDQLSGGNSAATAAGYYSGPGGMKAFMKGQARYDSMNKNAPSSVKYSNQVMSRMGQDVPVSGRVASANGNAAASPSFAGVGQAAPSSTGSAYSPAQMAQYIPLAPIEQIPTQQQAAGLDAWSAFNQQMAKALQEQQTTAEAQVQKQSAMREQELMALLSSYGSDQVPNMGGLEAFQGWL